MDDKEINEYCNNDVKITKKYQRYTNSYKIDLLAKSNLKLIDEVMLLKFRVKILYCIVALLVILKIIGG